MINNPEINAKIIIELRKSKSGKQTRTFTGKEISQFIVDYNHLYGNGNPGVLMTKRLLSLKRKNTKLDYKILRDLFTYYEDIYPKLSFSVCNILLENMTITEEDFFKDFKNLCFFKDKIFKKNKKLVNSRMLASTKLLEKLSLTKTDPVYRKEAFFSSGLSDGKILNAEKYPIELVLKNELSFDWNTIINEKRVSNEWLDNFIDLKLQEQSTFLLDKLILIFASYPNLKIETFYKLFKAFRKVLVRDRDIYSQIYFLWICLHEREDLENDDEFKEIVSFFYRCLITFSWQHFHEIKRCAWVVDDTESPDNIEKCYIVPELIRAIKESDFDLDRKTVISKDLVNPYTLINDAVTLGFEKSNQLKGD